MQKLLPPDTVITNDAANFSGWLHSFYQLTIKNKLCGTDSRSNGIWSTRWFGEKMAQPDQTVVSLSGDGGFMMTMQELETALRYVTPSISLVSDNSMYGTIRMHQEKTFLTVSL